MPMKKSQSQGRRGAPRRVRTTKRGVTAKMSVPTTKAVKAIVAQAISRAAETKFVSSYAAETAPNTYTSFNSTIAGATQWSSGLPPLPQSTAASSSYTRVGEVISPRQNKVAVDVRLKPTLNPVDITVVCYWGVCKKYKTYADVVTNSTALCNELLKLGGITAGGAENQAFNGIRSDSHLVINTDVFNFRKKTFRLQKAPGVPNGGASAGVLSSQNTVGHSFMLDWKSFLPEKVKYDLNADTYPIGYIPIWTLGYYYNDGTAPDNTSGSGIVEYKANRFLTFKDM